MTFEPETGTRALSSGNTRTITAFFDNRDDAQEAVDALRAQGVASSDIEMIAGNNPETGPESTENRPYQDEGFWASLSNLFMPDEDRYTYAEGLQRGGYLVTVQTTSADYDAILAILDREGSVDLDERSSGWRSAGWDYQAKSRSSDLPDNVMSRGMEEDNAVLGQDRDLSANETRAPMGDQAIPIAQEQLRVGKREANEGRVRVRSYVVEQPVEQDVELRQERVNVERRPVDRPTGGADLFQERTIELEERGEEAVVSKEARIVEEVRLGKEETFRTQKVRDTVRHTEVEVEDERRAAETRTTNTSTGKDVRRSS